MNDIQSFFQENGYYLARGIFSAEELRDLERDFDRIVLQLQQSKENITSRCTDQNRISPRKPARPCWFSCMRATTAWSRGLAIRMSGWSCAAGIPFRPASAPRLSERADAKDD